MKNPVNLQLVGLDGNAYFLLGAFRTQARQDGWTSEEIKEVTDKATSGDYYNLVATLSENCVNGGVVDDEDMICPESDYNEDDDDYDEDEDEEGKLDWGRDEIEE